jgi:hypothetical protein
VLLLQKDVLKAAKFYQQGLDLRVNVLTHKWAELQAGSSVIALKAVDGWEQSPFTSLTYSFPAYSRKHSVNRTDRISLALRLERCNYSEAYTTCGYTPFLAFEVADLQGCVQRLLQMGATLDGPIKYPDRGKVTNS